MDLHARNTVLAEAERRRDEEVLFAQRQLTEWRRTVGARQRSVPPSLHVFEDR
jgi:hypothetical protein